MIVSTAPGRCGIAGNPSDMYGGSVLSLTTRECARCELWESDEIIIESVDSGERSVIKSGEELALKGDRLDIARAALIWFGIDPQHHRFHLRTSTEIPMQAGLAGSTALVVAIVGALDKVLGRSLHPWAIAETARKIEYRIMNVLCGLQDQHMAVFGGLNYMDFAGKESLEQRDDEPLATVEPLLSSTSDSEWHPIFVLAHTGVSHHSGQVHKTPRERWLEGDQEVIDSYARVASLARLAKRALLDHHHAMLGELMNENHRIVSDLGGSAVENDRLIQSAREAGAFGAKLAGAGGGGTIIALCDDVDEMSSVLLAAGADRIMIPEPMPGLTVEISLTDQQDLLDSDGTRGTD